MLAALIGEMMERTRGRGGVYGGVFFYFGAANWMEYAEEVDIADM